MSPQKRARSKSYDIQFPINAQQVENINANFDRLFADLHEADTSTWYTNGILQTEHGGTGLSGFGIGDLLYASNITTLSRLPIGPIGYALISGGPGAAPYWGQLLHNLLQSTVHTDTLTGTVVRGDVIVGNATPKWSRLAIGLAGRFLRSDGTDVSWGVDGTSLTNIQETNIPNGSLLARNADTETISGDWLHTNRVRVTVGAFGSVTLYDSGGFMLHAISDSTGYYAAEFKNTTATGPGIRIVAGSSVTEYAINGYTYDLGTQIYYVKGDGSAYFKGNVTANIIGTATPLWKRVLLAAGLGYHG